MQQVTGILISLSMDLYLKIVTQLNVGNKVDSYRLIDIHIHKFKELSLYFKLI